jgi:DNA-directed RNA polymerase subunit H (RpoH/RPB5)
MEKSFIKNKLEILQTILYNCLLMLKRRGYISNVDTVYKKYMPTSISMNNFKIVDNNMTNYIYINNVDMNSIKKSSPIDDFLSTDINMKKFLITPTINKKILSQILDKYPNSEIFKHTEMLEDIVSKNFIPKHTLLDKKEKEKLLEIYKSNNLPKIFKLDMMSRYYNASEGDIFRIERNSILSGKSIYYRIVIPGDVNKFF